MARLRSHNASRYRWGVRLWHGLEAVDERFDIEALSSHGGVTHFTFRRR